MNRRRQIAETPMMRSLYGLYGDNPEARKWLCKLSVKAARNGKLRRKVMNADGFEYVPEKLEK
ncbi:MAG: hypothetical protein FVQ84_09205 [Planctomycetes bacterium]|nr:hypothetical protein [Planctomycetota bacterium]